MTTTNCSPTDYAYNFNLPICPQCGYCPYCGRSNHQIPYVNVRPYTPYWVNPVYVISSGRGS